MASIAIGFCLPAAAVAPPRERRRPADWRPDACSCRRPARSTRAGVAGAAAEPPRGRATAPRTDHPGTIPAPAKRHAATPMERRPAARARARVLARTPAPGDPSAAEVVEQDLRPMPARRERQRERRRAPETARRCRSTPAAATARRYARRRGPAQQRGSPPAPRARSPPPHHRSTGRSAVAAGSADRPPAPDYTCSRRAGGICQSTNPHHPRGYNRARHRQDRDGVDGEKA